MALIACPECGKENVSDSAVACPYCGFNLREFYGREASSYAEVPTASDNPSESVVGSAITRKPPKKINVLLLLALVLLAALIAPIAVEGAKEAKAMRFYNSHNYEEALPLLEELCSHDGAGRIIVDYKKTTASYLGIVNYEDCKKVLTDCSFLRDLEEVVIINMEAPDDTPYTTLCTTELALLNKYRKADFYNSDIAECADYYISAVDHQLSSLDYEFLCEIQSGMVCGSMNCGEVLDYLYSNYNFMADNAEFIGTCINELPYERAWLSAFEELLANGSEEVKETNVRSSYVECYFKNNTPYISSRIYDFRFTKDEEGTQLLDTVYVSVDNIGPYEEFTVRADVPSGVSGNWWVWWNGCCYEEIIIS